MNNLPNAGILTLTQDDMPLLFHQADPVAIQAQRRFYVLLFAELGLLALGTLAGLFTILPINVGPLVVSGLSIPALPAADLAAAAIISVALIVRLIRISTHPETRWYEARAIAESAKSVAWRYAVGGRPFPLTMNPTDVNTLLLQRLREILTDVGKKSRSIVFSEDGQITEAMQNLRAASLPIRQGAYDIDRIKDQRVWYERKANWNHDRALLAHWTLVLLEVIAVTCSVMQAFRVLPLNLQALVASIIGAGIAWMQARRYQDLSASYRVAASEARALEHSIPRQSSTGDADHAREDTWAGFVDGAEGAFSREHQLWRATRDQ